MNSVVLMGRLTREPEVRWTQGEQPMAIARFSLAVDRRRVSADGQREADFINCTVFGRQAEFAEKYLTRGTRITCHGRIQTGSYTNQEGKTVYTTDVILDEIEFAESKSSQQNTAQNAQNAPYQQNVPQQSNVIPMTSQNVQNVQNAPQAYYQPRARQNAPQNVQNAPQNAMNNMQIGAQNYGFQQSNDGFMNIPDGVDDEGLPFN